MAQFSMIFFNVFYVVMEFIKTEEKYECGFLRDQSFLFHLSHFPEHSRVSEQMHFKSERVAFSSAGSISLLVLVLVR